MLSLLPDPSAPSPTSTKFCANPPNGDTLVLFPESVARAADQDRCCWRSRTHRGWCCSPRTLLLSPMIDMLLPMLPIPVTSVVPGAVSVVSDPVHVVTEVARAQHDVVARAVVVVTHDEGVVAVAEGAARRCCCRTVPAPEMARLAIKTQQVLQVRRVTAKLPLSLPIHPKLVPELRRRDDLIAGQRVAVRPR